MVLLRVKPDEVGHPLGQRSATFNIKRATLAPCIVADHFYYKGSCYLYSYTVI